MSQSSSATGLQHVVLFHFPEDLTEAAEAELHDLVFAFVPGIGTMSECRFGKDPTGARTRGYQYLLHTVFPDTATLAAYVEHPVHQKLLRWLDDRRCERLAFDYPIDATTDAYA